MYQVYVRTPLDFVWTVGKPYKSEKHAIACMGRAQANWSSHNVKYTFWVGEIRS